MPYDKCDAMFHRRWSRFWLSTLLLYVSLMGYAQQKGTIRGHVFDKKDGTAIPFATVVLQGTEYGTTTDIDGLFVLSAIPVGTYTLIVQYIGYDTARLEVEVKPSEVKYYRIFIKPQTVHLKAVQVSGKKAAARRNVQISTVSITPTQIQALPSVGGEPDIAQYLRILPGVISTGVQGGQIYIRGGSPVQNMILLDGMLIFSPFHSIGFFSVFETEMIQNVNVYTGGFGVEYGDRLSAVVDIRTRHGNMRRYAGFVSLSPFQMRTMLEGPIIKDRTGKGSALSFMLAYKNSVLPYSSPYLYRYAVVDSIGSLPFYYTDWYGTVSLLLGGGSHARLFGFRHSDAVIYPNIAQYQWHANGGGLKFKILPPQSSLLIEGLFAGSTYQIQERIPQPPGIREKPRSSIVSAFDAYVRFTRHLGDNRLMYGFNFQTLSTDIRFVNAIDITFQQRINNTTMASYAKYKWKWNQLIGEAGIRATFYASLADFRFEPRLGFKYNIHPDFRLKGAFGLYSQQLMSTTNERDIVNLFIGYLIAPQLQTGTHYIGGIEWDLSDHWQWNAEMYYKNYELLLSLNRDRREPSDPEYIREKGRAYGLDILLTNRSERHYLWVAYSLGFVTRDNGQQVYYATFDRRHNVNALLSYKLGKKIPIELSLRWNFGTGFKFTKLYGFAEKQVYPDLQDDPRTKNGEVVPVFSETINGGVLPDYHRLDLSVKYAREINQHLFADVIFSVTNAYNRRNIFFVNPLKAEDKIYQLPILPSLGLKLGFK